MFYGDYRRRLELLKTILELVPKESTVLDAGGAPGFTSLALKLYGYDVYCVDINPEPYRHILENSGIKVLKVDLEHEKIPLSDCSINCVVFTEVLEHLHYYYLSWALSEINRVLTKNGLLFLTTPNIASIGKRIKLFLGKQPLGNFHVREYSMQEIIKMLREHGFSIIRRWFFYAYNLTPHDANGKEYKDNLIKVALKHPTLGNIFHVISLPIIPAIP